MGLARIHSSVIVTETSLNRRLQGKQHVMEGNCHGCRCTERLPTRGRTVRNSTNEVAQHQGQTLEDGHVHEDRGTYTPKEESEIPHPHTKAYSAGPPDALSQCTLDSEHLMCDGRFCTELDPWSLEVSIRPIFVLTRVLIFHVDFRGIGVSLRYSARPLQHENRQRQKMHEGWTLFQSRL